MPEYVVIEHPLTGVQYAILPEHFDSVPNADGKTYKDEGFTIVSYEDGRPYKADAPTPPAPDVAPDVTPSP